MGFSNLPRKAQIYLLAICGLGVAAAIAVILGSWPSAKGDVWEMGLFVALAIVLGGKKIALFRHLGDDDAVSMSMGFVITFAGMLRFGPTGAFALGSLSCLSGCLYPRKQPLYQLVFNVSLSATEAFLGSLVYIALNGWTLEMLPITTFFAVCASTAVFFASNTGGVSGIIALCSGDKAWKVWKETFLWTFPSYLAGACISALAMVLFGKSFGYVILFIAPVAFFTYHSYSVYTARAEEKLRHLEEVQQNQARLADLYLSTIKSLALAIDAKDQYTHQHILRVQRYAVAIAKEMGLTGGDLEAVNTGALLHDIGKLGVPEYVLLKPGRLTEDEFNKIKMHPEIGAAILDPVEFPWPVLPVVKYHHEKWDGTGYPEGLKGEEIPLTARIMAVADVYDALTSSRSYRSAWTHERAYDVICKDVGTHFDANVVEAFKIVILDVIKEMEAEGEGPLIARPATPEPALGKTAEAARAISKTSSELWALYEVAQTLSSSLGLKDTIDILARKLEGIFPGVSCLFLLKSEDSLRLQVRAAVGLNKEYFESASTISQKSRSFEVGHAGDTYRGEYDPDDLMPGHSDLATWTPLQSALIVPISYEGQVLGTINIYHAEAEMFSDHDQQLLETVADKAAMAIFNGILFENARSGSANDPLTGVRNMTYLTDVVERQCSIDQNFALLCFDLDNFKAINDNFGHAKGDQILKDVAQILKDSTNENDVVARYSGDQFLVVLNDVEKDRADKIAQWLLVKISEYNAGLTHPSFGSLALESSFGSAIFPTDGSDYPSLLSVSISALNIQKTERKLRTLAGRKTEIDGQKKAA